MALDTGYIQECGNPYRHNIFCECGPQDSLPAYFLHRSGLYLYHAVLKSSVESGRLPLLRLQVRVCACVSGKHSRGRNHQNIRSQNKILGTNAGKVYEASSIQACLVLYFLRIGAGLRYCKYCPAWICPRLWCGAQTARLQHCCHSHNNFPADELKLGAQDYRQAHSKPRVLFPHQLSTFCLT